jgi:nicotinamide-nucleotide amidase
MIGEIITIGNELISGKTRDLNGWYAAGSLTRAGLKIKRMTSVGDDPETVVLILREALRSSNFVLVTGGLGSTEDDITNEIVAEALNRPLCLNDEMMERIKRAAEKRSIPVTRSLMKMAYMPEGSKLICKKGMACGFYVVEGEVPLYFLPGIPEQMRYLLDNYVVPDMVARFQIRDVRGFRIIKTYGITEPDMAERFREYSDLGKEVVLGFYPNFPENHITITAYGPDDQKVNELLDQAQTKILERLGEFVFSVGEKEMEEVVGERLRERGLSLSTAESCTGGLVGHRITNVPGSSQYYLGGVVAYSNEVKIQFLGVGEETLKRHGAVSQETVIEMAEGIRHRTGSTIAVATSGIAGPSGGTDYKPVGTVCIGLVSPDRREADTYRFFGSRLEIKANSASMALDWVRRYLDGYPFIPGIRAQ